MGIQSLSYNQDVSLLVVGTDNGFAIYDLNPDIEVKLKYDKLGGGVGVMRGLYRTNLFVIIGGGIDPFKSKNVCIVWDDSRKTDVLNIQTNGPINNALLSKDRIVIVNRKQITVFDHEGDTQDIKATYANDKGICVINSYEKKPVIATLGSKKGEILVWKLNLNECKTIQAHESNIECIALNTDGSLVATASEKGTIIRVFNVESGENIYSFRRGSIGASIYDICFSQEAHPYYLACCSNNGTVHIFELYNDKNKSKNIKSVFSGLEDYIPSIMNGEYFGSEWGFKQIPINSTEKMICGFSKDNVLHVTCYDGRYYKIFGKEFENIKENNLLIDST